MPANVTEDGYAFLPGEELWLAEGQEGSPTVIETSAAKLVSEPVARAAGSSALVGRTPGAILGYHECYEATWSGPPYPMPSLGQSPGSPNFSRY